jgi:hypothetical protein
MLSSCTSRARATAAFVCVHSRPANLGRGRASVLGKQMDDFEVRVAEGSEVADAFARRDTRESLWVRQQDIERLLGLIARYIQLRPPCHPLTVKVRARWHRFL